MNTPNDFGGISLCKVQNYSDICAGAVPGELGALFSLKTLDLSVNQLSGEQWNSIGKMMNPAHAGNWRPL